MLQQKPDKHAILESLKDAHIPSLILALVHLTGDLSLVTKDNTPRYRLGDSDIQGGLSPEVQRQVRDRALHVLDDYLGNLRVLQSPSPDTLKAMMNFAAGGEIPDRYLPFLLEQLGISGGDPQKPSWNMAEIAPARKAQSAVIVGAGMSGLLAAMRLTQAGVACRILEKNPDLGGTWYENTYPGCRVDSSNYTYSYSFEPNYPWPSHFSTQDVILEYFREFAARHDLRKLITFNANVTEGVFDEERASWRLTAEVDGRQELIEASILITAVGQLNRPQLPDILGLEDFAGPAFHTATWAHDVDLTNKRVAVIGTGASAFQVVPSIADKVGELYVYQRSGPWLLPTSEYHDKVSSGEQWLLENVPFYEKWYRFYLFWLVTDGSYEFMKVDPAWDMNHGSISRSNSYLRQLVVTHISAQVPDDPDLLAKVIPNYHFGGKRAVRDNGVWVKALQRDNVHLVTEGIEQITRTGIKTADNVETEVDVIIYGTGFKASRFLFPMRIVGRDGVEINEQWNGDARAYLGIVVPNFPNFFMLYGPNTNIVVNGSVIFMSECSVRYILGCIELLARAGAKTLEVRSPVYDEFTERVDEMSRQLAWGAPNVTSWYKNARGRVVSVWPFRIVEYWERTLKPDQDEFILDGAKHSGDSMTRQ